MSTISELERRLEEQKQRVAKKRGRRNWLRAEIRRKGIRIEELIDRIDEARDDRLRNRDQLVLIRDRLEVVELDGVSEEERDRYRTLIERLEGEVDANEELTALIHDALARVAELRERRGGLKELRNKYREELEQALDRRRRIERALAQAIEDQASNPLDSRYFVVEEFDCRDGTPVPKAAYPALKANVKSYLEPLRKSAGPVHINSGYRTRSYNAAVGGASNSIHIYDEHPDATAADHWQEGRAPGDVQRWHDQNTHPDGMGYYSSFTHVDNRNRIGWPDSRWNGP